MPGQQQVVDGREQQHRAPLRIRRLHRQRDRLAVVGDRARQRGVERFVGAVRIREDTEVVRERVGVVRSPIARRHAGLDDAVLLQVAAAMIDSRVGPSVSAISFCFAPSGIGSSSAETVADPCRVVEAIRLRDRRTAPVACRPIRRPAVAYVPLRGAGRCARAAHDKASRRSVNATTCSVSSGSTSATISPSASMRRAPMREALGSGRRDLEHAELLHVPVVDARAAADVRGLDAALGDLAGPCGSGTTPNSARSRIALRTMSM